MKLSDMVLTEAARFGNSQKQMVLRDINNFRFGLEYEFNVQDEIGGVKLTNYIDAIDNDPERSRFMDRVLPEIDFLTAAYGKIVRDASSALVDLPGVIRQLGSALRSGISDNEADFFIDIYKPDYEKLGDLFRGIVAHTYALDQVVEKRIKGGLGLYQRSSDPKIINLVKRIGKTNVSKGSVLIVKESFLEDMLIVFTELHNHIRKELKVDIFRGEAEIREKLSDVIMGSYDNNRQAPMNSEKLSKVDFVKNTLGLPSKYIENVLADTTVYKGVEVVTQPLNFKDTLNVMKHIFDYIKKVGYTDGTTGLHLNISTRKRFDEVNPIKVMTLLSGSYVEARWIPRFDYTKDNVSYLATKNRVGLTPLHNLAKIYSEKGSEAFIKMYEGYLKAFGDKKFARFNIESLLPTNAKYIKGRNRIEYRAMGGTGYELRTDDIVNDMLHVCYLIMAAIEPDFIRNDYLSAIIRSLDSITPSATDGKYQKFGDVIAIYRKGRYIP